MSILPVFRKRSSVRRFKPEQVPRSIIARCLAAARLAPSAENSQPWHFILVDDPTTRSALSAKAFSGIYSVGRGLKEAPLLVVLLAKPGPITHRLGASFQGLDFLGLDMGIAGEHFILQATSEGLGTCWIGWFNVKAVRSFLGIPRRSWRIAAMIAVGYPQHQDKKKPRRKSLASMISWNRFGGPPSTIGS